jgi:hypothetical protein
MSEWRSVFDAPEGEWVEAIWGRNNESAEYEAEIAEVRLLTDYSEFPYRWEDRDGDDCTTPWGWRPIKAH